MKTTVSVPNVLFKRAEQLARNTKTSRSRLYSEAISEYLARHDASEITRTLDEIYSRQQSGLHPSLSESARKALACSEW